MGNVNLITGYRIKSIIIDGNGRSYPRASYVDADKRVIEVVLEAGE